MYLIIVWVTNSTFIIILVQKRIKNISSIYVVRSLLTHFFDEFCIFSFNLLEIIIIINVVKRFKKNVCKLAILKKQYQIDFDIDHIFLFMFFKLSQSVKWRSDKVKPKCEITFGQSFTSK